MTYGRLDVYWPDGPMKSYQLSKANVAIGRSPGNDVMLDANAISRYHATLSLKDGDVLLEDLGSINGTYVDGRKLAPNTPSPLTGGEELQIGEVRLIFHSADDSPTQPFIPDDATQRIAYEQPTYRLELIAPEQAIAPGVFSQAVIIIQNLSDEEDHYFIEIDGIPREWARLERVDLALSPDQTAHILLSLKPLRKPDTRPGSYTVIVRVRSKSRPVQTVDAEMHLRVLSYSGFGIDLGRKLIKPGDTLPIHIHNQGNTPLRLSFSGRHAQNALAFAFAPQGTTLDPGARMTVRAHVKPRRPQFLGARQEYPFVVTAQSHDAAGFLTPLAARLVVEPLLTGWRLVAAAGGLLALALAALALLAVLLNPQPDPRITSMRVSSAEIVQDIPLTVNWTVQDAAGLYLEVDGIRQDQTLTPLDTSAVVTLTRPGEHEIALVATSGDKTTREAVRVLVAEPLVIVNFSASPAKQVRYITQEIVLTWEVPGARQVRLAGLPGDDGSATYAPTDARQVRLNGALPIEVTLLAEGGAGQMAERVLPIPVEDPVCVVTRKQTPFRTGPSDLHTVLGTVSEGQMVVPDKRDGSGEWLRVFANDNQHVWITSSVLQCLNLDPMLLSVDPAPPTPVPTQTPTITPSATVTPPPTITVLASPTALPSATPPPVTGP